MSRNKRMRLFQTSALRFLEQLTAKMWFCNFLSFYEVELETICKKFYY
jgi:hypothetical protein